MSSEGRLACASCGGAYTVDGSGPNGQVVLRCGACGAEVSATLLLGTPATSEAPPEVANASASQPPPPTDASKRSAASLLDDTPPSRERRFSLLAEAPILPPPKSVPPIKAAPEVVSREDIAISSSSLVDAVPSERQLEEIASDELEDAPPSVRIAAAALVPMASKAPPPPPMSKAPPPPAVSKAPPPPAVSKAPPPLELAEDDDDAGAEPVSLKEMAVVSSTPHAPKAGELRTLPPSAMSAPPPTIEVPSRPPPASVRPARSRSDAPAAARAPDAEGRSPFVWMALAAAVASVAWLVFRGSGPSQTITTSSSDAPRASAGSPSSTPAASAAAATARSAGSATATPSASAFGGVAEQPPELVASRAGASTAAAGSPVQVAAGAGAGAAAGGNIADLLERASRARHAGDLAKARAVYTQVLAVHPGDVEASSGLGEVSRMSGDLAGAKRYFQDALAASPTFYPALLGLGDTLWELGDKFEAQRVYARLLSVRDTVPERVRDRAQPGGAASKPMPTAKPAAPPENVEPAPAATGDAPKAD
jgi:TolA-binding protein